MRDLDLSIQVVYLEHLDAHDHLIDRMEAELLHDCAQIVRGVVEIDDVSKLAGALCTLLAILTGDTSGASVQ